MGPQSMRLRWLLSHYPVVKDRVRCQVRHPSAGNSIVSSATDVKNFSGFLAGSKPSRKAAISVELTAILQTYCTLFLALCQDLLHSQNCLGNAEDGSKEIRRSGLHRANSKGPMDCTCSDRQGRNHSAVLRPPPSGTVVYVALGGLSRAFCTVFCISSQTARTQ